MEKKTIYVVTTTYVDLTDYSFDTFVRGTSDCLSCAKSILDNERIKILEMGYLPDRFELFPLEWTYKHKYGSIKCEIHLVRE